MAEKTKRELPDTIQEAEAIARADESRASVMRRKALTDQNYKAASEAAARDAKESSDHLAKLERHAVSGETDLSGVTLLSDSEGNFAPNAEVAATGGTGVVASNTNPDTGEQAQTAQEAGEVEIPATWQETHWRTRVALAERISGRDDVKADEANEIIAAEVERRG